MRISYFILSTMILTASGCSSIPRQNHLGLEDAPYGVVVDSAAASNPSPITSTRNHAWKRSGIQKQAEQESIKRDAPYSSLR